MLGKMLRHMMTKIRRFSELVRLETFEERFKYLMLGGQVGRETFGFDRYINQSFYTSRDWKNARRTVIIRDNGCDLGVYEHEIYGTPLIHHMNPMTVDDIKNGEQWIVDPEYLICVSNSTHNAIHYGDETLIQKYNFVPRKPGDTKLW
jgi:hypothetical protein